MVCTNCRCEIGTLTVCPYCGAQNRQNQPSQGYTARIIYRTEEPAGGKNETSESSPWGLTCAVLLGGIFVLELLQLIFMLLQ